MEKKIIGEDNICPETGEPCLDECCPAGSVCNIGGNSDLLAPAEPEKQ